MKKAPEDIDALHAKGAIAVIGMAGRFPGARNLDEFRSNLEAGVESITVLSDAELLDAGASEPAGDPRPSRLSRSSTARTCSMRRSSVFAARSRDHGSATAAFLECAWEALQDEAEPVPSRPAWCSQCGRHHEHVLLSDTRFTPQLTVRRPASSTSATTRTTSAPRLISSTFAARASRYERLLDVAGRRALPVRAC
jgi:hypothetical protein